MGVYDCITFNCPDCGATYVAQSKSGDCVLASYDFTSVPVSVAYDANRHAPFECECGAVWVFGNIPDFSEQRVELSLEKVND